jgi:hypothetical protein
LLTDEMLSARVLLGAEPVPELDRSGVVEVLNRHGVRYIVIGGVAAEIHDLPVPATVDIDVTPARDRPNLERLARAFDELDAGLYSAEETGTRFPRTPVELWSQYDTLHLMTKSGPIDVVFAPDGAPMGYAALVDRSIRAKLDDQPVVVITVATWKSMKQAAGHAKDLEHLDRHDEARRDKKV